MTVVIWVCKVDVRIAIKGDGLAERSSLRERVCAAAATATAQGVYRRRGEGILQPAFEAGAGWRRSASHRRRCER